MFPIQKMRIFVQDQGKQGIARKA